MLLLALAPGARAADAPVPPEAARHWNIQSALQPGLPPEELPANGIRFDDTGLALNSPLLATTPAPASSAGASPARRFFRSPVVRFIVPQRLPVPSGGKYFAWGRSNRPWTALVENATPRGGFAGRPFNPESQNRLLSLEW
jgi:hypothetical protein